MVFADDFGINDQVYILKIFNELRAINQITILLLLQIQTYLFSV